MRPTFEKSSDMRPPSTTDPSNHLHESRAIPRILQRLSIGATLLASTLLIVRPLAADAQDDLVRGIPSIHSWNLYGGPEIGLYGFSAKGGSTSTRITGPRIRNPNFTFGDLGPDVSAPERSREREISFLAGATLGVLTPGIDIPGRPRAFLELNVSVPQTTETQFARRGNPGQLAIPNLPGGGENSTPYGEGTLAGIGTAISAQQQGPQVQAGVGISFEFPIPGDQLIRIKPGAIYSRTILDLKATTRRAVRLNGDTGNNQTLEDFRFILLDDAVTEVYHAAGPSLELEYVPGLQWGPFGFSLFARASAAYTFNTLKTEMQQCNVAGGQPNECARWKYTQDAWAYRATAGFHVNWIPQRFW
ncbi:hypothetical protein K2X89_17270 [Myxococcota bacterium]|nr:hypothetical protein [Myxococcota bacterium]